MKQKKGICLDAMEWINVKERLPPENTQILALVGNRRVIGEYFENKFFDDFWIDSQAIIISSSQLILFEKNLWISDNFTHWMINFLPPLPKETNV